MVNAVFLALLGLDCDGTHEHVAIGFDKDIRIDQFNAFAWALVHEWADLVARWLLACTNLRGNKSNSGAVCVHCAVEACDNKRDGQPKTTVPKGLKQQVIDTCRRVRLTALEQINWDCYELATAANACGEPVLRVTARAGARFVKACHPDRKFFH